MSYPEYVERMLAGSAVLRTKLQDEALGILTLGEDLETLSFSPSPSSQESVSLACVTNLEISEEEISMHLADGSCWLLEFPDSKIFADWSYGLQVLTVESEISCDEISDLLREATDLNAKLLEDNLRLQHALTLRDDFINTLLSKKYTLAEPSVAQSDCGKSGMTGDKAPVVFQDWHEVSKTEVQSIYSARFRDA